ncbi:MAG TPA: TolC family protein [Elusimicrobiota bacterium]|nr:TolC family protein [Elusimicrobiota bacterium]
MKSALLLAALLAGAPRAFAETEPLTWDRVEALAAQENPDLASSRFSLESSRASFYQSFNSVMPQVNLSNALNEAKVMPANRWTAQATASMNFFDMSSIASIRAASANLSLGEANLRRTSADLRQNVRTAFTHLLFAQESLKVARLVSALRDRAGGMIGLRYDSGTAAKGDKMLADAQSLQARLSIVAAERDVRAAQRELGQRLGREDYEDFVASGTLGAAAPPARPEDLRSLLALIPEIQVSQAQVRQAGVGVAQAESSLWPTLTGDYARSVAGPKEFPRSAYGWNAALTLSYPLFGAGPTSTWFGVKSAKRALDAARMNLVSARVAGLESLESAWAAYADAVDQVEVQNALLAADRQRNDEADVEYASGLLIYANWEQIASTRITAESQRISALRNAMDAETSWNRALGRALGE